MDSSGSEALRDLDKILAFCGFALIPRMLLSESQTSSAFEGSFSCKEAEA